MTRISQLKIVAAIIWMEPTTTLVTIKKHMSESDRVLCPNEWTVEDMKGVVYGITVTERSGVT